MECHFAAPKCDVAALHGVTNAPLPHIAGALRAPSALQRALAVLQRHVAVTLPHVAVQQ